MGLLYPATYGLQVKLNYTITSQHVVINEENLMENKNNPGLVGLADLLKDVVQDLYKEGPAQVASKIAKAQYTGYVCITYSKTPGGFALQGQIQMLENLLCPIYNPRGGSGKYVDGLVLNALTAHAQYDKQGRKNALKRIPEKYYYSDGDALTFMKFVKVDDYKPSCLVFAKLTADVRDKLLARDDGVWEDYFLMAERELRQRCRQWKRNTKQQRRTA
jgi:hypothetical protein